MNILFIHGASDLYGSGRILSDIVKVATKNGHYCWIILPENGELCSLLINPNVIVLFKDVGVIRRKYLNIIGIINRIYNIIVSLFYLTYIIKKNKIDLVYSNTIAIISGSIIAKLLVIKHIWHIHEILESPRILVKFLSILLDKLSLYCIAVSNAVKNHWVNYGVNESKILMIYNGINYKSFLSTSSKIRHELHIPDNYTVVGMIGRISKLKGQEYFVKIAANLVRFNNEIIFVMVGDVFPGNEYIYKNINSLINKHELNSIVHILGFRKDIADILASMDIYIHPSVQPDSLPTSVLEAMSAGKVVFATNNGGANEIIMDGMTGYFIPDNDPFLAAIIISKLLKQKNKIVELGLRGQARVKNDFSLEVFEYKINLLLEEIKRLK